MPTMQKMSNNADPQLALYLSYMVDLCRGQVNDKHAHPSQQPNRNMWQHVGPQRKQSGCSNSSAKYQTRKRKYQFPCCVTIRVLFDWFEILSFISEPSILMSNITSSVTSKRVERLTYNISLQTINLLMSSPNH